MHFFTTQNHFLDDSDHWLRLRDEFRACFAPLHSLADVCASSPDYVEMAGALSGLIEQAETRLQHLADTIESSIGTVGFLPIEPGSPRFCRAFIIPVPDGVPVAQWHGARGVKHGLFHVEMVRPRNNEVAS